MESQDEIPRYQSHFSHLMACIAKPVVALLGLVATVSVVEDVEAAVVEAEVVPLNVGEPLPSLMAVVAVVVVISSLLVVAVVVSLLVVVLISS